MHNHLQRIMRLVRKTGDRVIVTDSNNSEESFVLMSFEDYELLMEDRFEAIGDEEPAAWEDVEETDGQWAPETLEVEDEWVADSVAGEETRESAAAIEDEGSWQGEIPPEAYEAGNAAQPEEALDNEAGYGTIRTADNKHPKKRKNWQIPPEIKRGSEAVEEDRYYLENV